MATSRCTLGGGWDNWGEMGWTARRRGEEGTRSAAGPFLLPTQRRQTVRTLKSLNALT